jgi:hypothetical protein
MMRDNEALLWASVFERRKSKCHGNSKKTREARREIIAYNYPTGITSRKVIE